MPILFCPYVKISLGSFFLVIVVYIGRQVFYDNGGTGTPIHQVEEEAPLSFLLLSRTGRRVIIQPWVGRASRPNLCGVISTNFFPLVTSLMTNAPFSRRPAI